MLLRATAPLRVTGQLANKLQHKTPSRLRGRVDESGGGWRRRWQMPDLGPSRWSLMNPEKKELKPGEVAKRPAVIIATPVGSLSIREAVGASDSCGRW